WNLNLNPPHTRNSGYLPAERENEILPWRVLRHTGVTPGVPAFDASFSTERGRSDPRTIGMLSIAMDLLPQRRPVSGCERITP
ncbi:hypothetical protein, partial [Burkholderia multivorans]|uniref:hypothetical protein n=1 Tax=Burkholderia multivorans TaxID=87883 RepID=UPI0021C0301E